MGQRVRPGCLWGVSVRSSRVIDLWNIRRGSLMSSASHIQIPLVIWSKCSRTLQWGAAEPSTYSSELAGYESGSHCGGRPCHLCILHGPRERKLLGTQPWNTEAGWFHGLEQVEGFQVRGHGELWTLDTLPSPHSLPSIKALSMGEIKYPLHSV